MPEQTNAVKSWKKTHKAQDSAFQKQYKCGLEELKFEATKTMI